jgi:hypothetical protein
MHSASYPAKFTWRTGGSSPRCESAVPPGTATIYAFKQKRNSEKKTIAGIFPKLRAAHESICMEANPYCDCLFLVEVDAVARSHTSIPLVCHCEEAARDKQRNRLSSE